MHGSSELWSASERRAEFVEPMECLSVAKLASVLRLRAAALVHHSEAMLTRFGPSFRPEYD